MSILSVFCRVYASAWISSESYQRWLLSNLFLTMAAKTAKSSFLTWSDMGAGLNLAQSSDPCLWLAGGTHQETKHLSRQGSQWRTGSYRPWCSAFNSHLLNMAPPEKDFHGTLYSSIFDSARLTGWPPWPNPAQLSKERQDMAVVPSIQTRTC